MAKKYFLVVVLICVFLGRGFATETDADYQRAIIKPSLVRLEPGRRQRYKVIMLPRYLKEASLAEDVKWSVNGIAGGNKQVGTIDNEGLYAAPKKVPKPREVHICAEVNGANNRYLFATVLFGEPSYKLVRVWSEPKESAKYIKDPHGICLDSEGNVLIADRDTSRVMRFTPDGKFTEYIDPGGGKPGELTEPRVVIIDAKGRIYVSDSKADGPRIQMYTPKGEFIRAFAHKGIGPGQLLRAHGMDFDRRGRLFVVDVDNFRVNVYTDSGEFLYDWGEPGLKAAKFNAPHGLCVDPSGDVFVSNYYGPTQKFDADGNLLFEFAQGDPPDGPVGFHSISSDRWGNVFFTVRSQQEIGERLAEQSEQIRIAKYNNNGDFITGWALAGGGGADWIAVGDDDTVYCAFADGSRAGVQVFEPE